MCAVQVLKLLLSSSSYFHSGFHAQKKCSSYCFYTLFFFLSNFTVLIFFFFACVRVFYTYFTQPVFQPCFPLCDFLFSFFKGLKASTLFIFLYYCYYCYYETCVVLFAVLIFISKKIKKKGRKRKTVYLKFKLAHNEAKKEHHCVGVCVCACWLLFPSQVRNATQ